jgi:thymidylate synthase (FAD)
MQETNSLKSTAKLVWITPEAEETIAYVARVSNPSGQEKPVGNLLSYCLRHGHYSVFEMASACVEITTTRDIARQILRHRSFSFQEFSQRYAEPSALTDEYVFREARLQDTKNRQNSIATDDEELQNWFDYQQHSIQFAAKQVYHEAIAKGIAKEQARVVLPEGLTMSRIYMSGTIRSFIHYCALRSGHGSQLEHSDVAKQISRILKDAFPLSGEQLFPTL